MLKACTILFSILATMPVLLPQVLYADAGDSEWTQWRGSHRDGRVAGASWPDDFQCLESMWRVELGEGYSGPIVTSDRIFVAETRDATYEVVRALRRSDGQELWRAEWKGSWKVPFFAAKNGSWIRSTPAWDGKSLFVGGIREVLVSLDGQTGEERWRIDFPARFGTEVPHFGFASSPLLDGDHLYVQAADSIVKLDKDSGEIVWRRLDGDGNIGSSGAFSSPVLETLAGRRQLLVQTRLELFGLDPESGDTLWSQPVPHFRGMNILTPTVHDDHIFTSSYRHGSFLYKISRNEQGFQSEEVWKHKSQGYMSSPVVIDGHAYLHLGNQRLTCIDLSTGQDVWASKPYGKYWSKAFQGDKILALDEGGDLLLLRASTEGLDVLDSRQISDAETWGHLAIAGDEIFVRELEAVAAYRWCAQKESSVASEPAP